MTKTPTIPLSQLRERMVSRSDPPNFMFKSVQTHALENIDQGPGQRYKATSIVAPVGYGKTVLMSSLYSRLQGRGEQCFWTSLDVRDHSLEQVLGLLEAMFYGPSAELHPTQALLHGDEPLHARIDELLETLSSYPALFTVFIDNLNSCTDETLGNLLDRLIFETPVTARFVFSSTTELPLNLARAKLEGLVRQISYTELSLNIEEIAELLGPELRTAIGPAGMETVLLQTEGWPAAARMVQIILSASDKPLALLERFSGSDEDLAAFLNRQVLSGFSTEVREFLLDIASLRTFCADLCRHATGNDEAEQHLALLIKRNVFVIPLDRNRTWYRLHGLFREYLLSEVAYESGMTRRQAILQRATEWCEQNGYWRDAIEYAIAVGASETACRILKRTAEIFVRDQGDVLQYTTWVETLHTRGCQLDWNAEYWYVWALVLHRRYEFGRQQNERLADRLRLAKSTATTAEELAQLEDLLRRMDIIRICIGLFTDDLRGTCQNAAHWLACALPADDPFDALAASCSQGIYYSCAFMFSEAREAMQTAQAYAFQVNSAYANGWLTLFNALIPLFEGDYAAVYQELATALATARSALGDGAGICGTIALQAAKCAVETGYDEEAKNMLRLGMRTIKFHGFVDAVACGLDAAVKLWTGSADDPISIADLRAVAASYPPRLSVMFSCFLVQRLILLNRFDEAQVEAARIGLNIDSNDAQVKLPRSMEIARSRDVFVATEIELCIAAGRHKQAELLIAEETRLANADGRSARRVELALAEMQIATQAGNTLAANRHLTRAVSIAAMRGIFRPFRDRARAIADLIEDTKPAAWGFALTKERKFFAEICRMLPISNRSLKERLVALNIESHLLKALSARQIELIHLLDAGLSNQQIADRINVSVWTIKGHLQRLYGKLGVSSRSAAIAQARALNLLT